MKAIILRKFEESPVLEVDTDREKPNPKPSEVLVQVKYGSINPSDLMFLRGLYGIKKKLPVVPGFEGSGVVVSVGSEIRHLKPGDRVACVAGSGDGTWGEYLTTDENSCIPLLDKVSFDQGASLFVNPMTAWAMVNRGLDQGHTGFVQTAGASALGKMVVRFCKELNRPLISIVRREDQVEELKGIGAENVLNSSDPRFDRELLVLSKKLNTTFCLDAVAGDVAGRTLNCMPANSVLLSYGALSEETIPVSAGIMIFQNKSIQGFWLTTWIREIGIENFHQEAKRVQEKLDTTFATKVNKIFPVTKGPEAVEFYKTNMTAGKVLIEPGI
jgi:NADPH:quinone reductase-like Zn-dependent oxidoreductase